VVEAGGSIVAGDSYGRLKLATFPCVSNTAPSASLLGHDGGGVGRVRWSSDDGVVLSVGARDRCLLQWRVHAAPPGELPPPAPRFGQPDEYVSRVRRRRRVQ
jgi:hypothetical protein